MGYEVLARKWRPQQFDEVIGQAHVTRTLRNAIEKGRVAHAYLFVGPRGIGKTSTARIFAKALNCVEGPTGNPCDQCDSCREIMSGKSLDVIEIDGASNTGVDHVRDLRENVQYAPACGPFKIYIIDEVHMLSMQAFNALLKTLEEPPSHVKFIFATTEPQKVPATILSRCQRFDLRKISTVDIVQHLGKIAAAEKIEINDEALLAIARGAQGGLRDAESALDQLMAFRGDSITEEDVLSVFGLVAGEQLSSMVDSILDGDIAALIKCVAELDEQGKDLQRVLIELVDHLKNLLIMMHTDGQADHLDLTAAQIEILDQQRGRVAADRILKMIELLTEAESRLRYALSRRTLVEIVLIRCARTARTATLDEIFSRLNELKNSGGAPAPVAPVKKKSLISESPPEEHDGEWQRLIKDWPSLCRRIGKASTFIQPYLKDCVPIRIDGERVVIGFDEEFAEDVERVNIHRNRALMQKLIAGVLNRDVTVAFETVSTEKVASVAEASERYRSENEAKTSPKNVGLIRQVEDWYGDPLVRKVCNLFDGQLTDVKG